MSIQQSLRRHLVIGVASVAVLMFIVFGWGTLSEISGAVIAPGKLVVDSNVKKVQHPTGGVVGTLNVKDGDRVKKGDIVVRLDETQARTSLAIVTKALDEFGQLAPDLGQLLADLGAQILVDLQDFQLDLGHAALGLGD